MSRSPILTLIKNGEKLEAFSVEGEVILGRAVGSTIRVQDRAISRHHAVFKLVGDQVQVEKKSQFAPLVVNGAECTSAVLKSGDIIAAGPYLLRLDSPDPVASPINDKNSVEKVSQSSESSAQDGELIEHVAAEGEEGSPEAGQESGLEGISDPLGGSENDSSDSDSAANSGVSSDPATDDPFASDPQPDDQADPFAVSSEGADPGLQMDGALGAADSQASPFDSGASPAEDTPVYGGGPIDEEAKTKITPMGHVAVKLLFQPGTANVTEYEMSKDVAYIGRGKDCDIVLNDKKASRKNTLIRKSGLSFVIKDLESANGTFVNGVRVQEQELSGDDIIKVGKVEFVFKAVNVDYLAKEGELESVPESEQLAVPDPLAMSDLQAGDPLGDGGQQIGDARITPSLDGSAGLDTGIPGITGIGGVGTGQKKTLLEKFRALPKRTQVIGVVAGVLLLWWLTEEDPVDVTPKQNAQGQVKPSPKPSATGPVTFEMLTPEQQSFVEAQHTLAFEHYKNKDYDKAIFEIQKIFTLVEDYKDSREIERYAKEGKRKMEVIEEERRKKEESEKLKARIAQLVEETRQKMEKKQYDQAKELFVEILGIDPDNQEINAWRKEIQDYEEEKARLAKEKEVQGDINEHAWGLVKEADGIRKSGRYYEAIDVYQRAIDIGASDTKLIPLVKKMIALCHRSIARKRNPILAQAKEKEDDGDFSAAYKLYKKATQVDPHHRAGYAGMNRIRTVLHDRAKVAYTEAILAESYSDFTTAKKMFEECLKIAPPGDIYHDRARRKLSRYFTKKEESF